MRKEFLLQVFGAILIVFMYLSPQAMAAKLSAGDHSEFQRIITAQIKAFQTGDGTGAYDFAAPSVQVLFRDAKMFVAMVKRNYKPVFQPQSFSFEAVSFKLGKPTQRLTVVGPAGLLWVASYGFERQKDNSWKIAGVVLFRHKGLDT